MSALTNPTVAVVIAHYNGARDIPKALISLQNQSRKPDEIIVVDDGSDQSDLEFLHSLQAKFKFKLLIQTNAGQSAARNYGVSNSTANLICFLDQDDYFLPNHISDLLGAWDFQDSRFAFTYGDLWRQTSDGIITSHSCIKIEGPHPHTDIASMIRRNLYILPSATMISRTAFLEVGGFDVQFRGYEDDDLFIRLFAAGYSNKYLDRAVTVWTLNRNSTSFSESMARSRFRYFQKLLDNFGAGQLPDLKVFGELLVPRFAFQFAADVIEAAMSDSVNFEERRQRLAAFIEVFRASKEIQASSKRKFLVATYPMLKLSPKQQKIMYLAAIKLSWLLRLAALPGTGDFLARYASREK